MSKILTVEISGVTTQGSTPPRHLTVIQKYDGHHRFEFTIPAPPKADYFANLKSHIDEIGTATTISFTNPDPQSSNESGSFMEKAYITEVVASREHQGQNNVLVRGMSPTARLEDGLYCRTFTKKTLKDIVDDILKAYDRDFSLKINPSYTSPIPYMVQYKESNYNFISRLAAMFGEWFYFDGKQLVFGKLAKTPIVKLAFGKNLSDVDLSVKANPLKFELLTYDYLTDKVKKFASDNAGTDNQHDLNRKAINKSNQIFDSNPTSIAGSFLKDSDDIERLVKRIKAGEAAEMVVLHGVSEDPTIKIGGTIEVSELGSMGNFIVTEIRHYADYSGNYYNQFEAIPEKITIPPVNTSIFIPQSESQHATVKDNKDPEKLGRVKVHFPWQDSSETTPWIRLVNTLGNAEKGFYFIPEIGEQVMVGFENGDPLRPYVLGSLYHGKAKPLSEWYNDQNEIKAIKTKSGNEIRLVDTGGKERIHIKTNNGENEIIIRVDKDGQISLKAKGAINLNAPNINLSGSKISLHASKSIKIESDDKLEISANEITQNAKMKQEMTSPQTKIKGDAKMEVAGANVDIKGSALVNVQGALIKLN